MTVDAKRTETSSSTAALVRRVLAYKNLEVVERFKHKLEISHIDAEELFMDVKRFLFLCVTNPGHTLSPTEKIDAGWHEFILYTKDYHDFCMEYLGRFVHHQPDSYLVPEKGISFHRRATSRSLAERIFGQLSDNWRSPQAKCRESDCTGSGSNCHGCKGCSEGGDCAGR